VKEQTAWRPIETAPKDGTPIDVWGPDHGRMTDVYWGKPHHECGEMGQYCDSDWHSLKPGWICGVFNEIVGRLRPGFTHWMPFPEPPALATTQDPKPDEFDPDIEARGGEPCAYPSCGCEPDAICHVAIAATTQDPRS
jgi:hypothetical protein